MIALKQGLDMHAALEFTGISEATLQRLLWPPGSIQMSRVGDA